jgi:hypothetical protein
VQRRDCTRGLLVLDSAAPTLDRYSGLYLPLPVNAQHASAAQTTSNMCTTTAYVALANMRQCAVSAVLACMLCTLCVHGQNECRMDPASAHQGCGLPQNLSNFQGASLVL